ncbi:hypothetical protein QTQ03_06380 [Micromonospora sp. WMMA1363]|uniref:hypothetical protein n=1 Tax=Micromonospora sp. WMMA1363 TaxID=3053985 RepID=UPI00259CE9F7|nr:hypothetical protein [Micromonospora sp. WMMA1363]MDM4719242.1 hypothetical protein [Micromonospora sp. WMMA1363]
MVERASRFRTAYGAGPAHLLVLLACFTLTGWVALRLSGEADAIRMLLWFLGAVVAHDLVLFPVYATMDRGLRRFAHRPAVVNHIRVPALASALLFLVYLPGILGLGGSTHTSATGREPTPLVGRWLVLSALFFALGAITYLVRRRRGPSAGDRTRR